MPAPSPTNIADATVRFTVKANGSPIKDIYPVVSVYVHHELNKISYAEIVLIDGTVESADFPISESNDLVPGNTIEITAGYGSIAEVSIFSGIIVKQGIKINPDEATHLIITCKHKAVLMSFEKKETQFNKLADSTIIKNIVSGYTGLSVTVDATSSTQEVSFQKLATDWDFILARADFYGYVVSFDADKIIVGYPSVSSSAVLRVAFGESLLSFNAELNAEHQATGVKVSGWDIKNQKLLDANATEPALNKQGNLSAKTLSSKLSQAKTILTSNTPLLSSDLKYWADATLLRMRLAALKGEISFIGNAAVKPNTIIDIEGVGDRFNGSAYISSVSHNIINGNWTTTAKFGLETKRVYEQTGFSYTDTLGQIPAIKGLQIGTVKKIYDDPESQCRVLVNLQSNAINQDGIWARVANFYATNEAGAFFFPEIGSEVVIGFLESDPRYPIILGSLYSSSTKAPTSPVDNNNDIKTIVTKNKLKITFNDKDKVTKIETPGSNSITFSDKDKSIEIADQNSNTVKMTSGGIDLNSRKNITIKATGNIELNATGKLSLTAAQDVSVAGLNIANTAKVGFTAKGNATAEISASGQTVVKGGIVMIN